MLKYYKKLNIPSEAELLRRLAAGGNSTSMKVGGFRLPKILAIPAMIVGGLITLAFFSAFFVVLAIPVSILSYKAWQLMRKAEKEAGENILDAEYTVIDDQEKK